MALLHNFYTCNENNKMFNPFFPNALPYRSLSLIPNSSGKPGFPEGMQEISQHKSVWGRNGGDDEKKWLLFTSQERGRFCVSGV